MKQIDQTSHASPLPAISRGVTDRFMTGDVGVGSRRASEEET